MAPSSTAPVRAAEAPLHLLLVEDDEGDAFLVSELLKEEDPSIVVRHVRSLAAAVESLSTEIPDCVLLDLGLPDATGLGALERLRAVRPGVAHLVLTGDRDVQRGVEAVAAGAQDYLIKGSVDGDGLRRAVLYAVERRQADHVRERLRAAEILAEEATRLERGLLPVPILNDGTLLVGTGYRPGRERTLLGGVMNAAAVVCFIIALIWCGPAFAELRITRDFDSVLPTADVIMMLRVQKERLSGLHLSVDDYIRDYQLTAERVALAPEEVLVMHPGPMVRGMELTSEVADSARSLVLEQVRNGVAVRRAILLRALGERA